VVAVGIRWKLYSLAGAAVAAEVVAYLLWRPRMLLWGATAEESTRAVTIDAPPEQVAVAAADGDRPRRVLHP
jgi:hypothetical protein